MLNQDYAAKIARDWNVPRSGARCVTWFLMRLPVLDRYPAASGRTEHHRVLKPAEDLDDLDDNIAGLIELAAKCQ